MVRNHVKKMSQSINSNTFPMKRIKTNHSARVSIAAHSSDMFSLLRKSRQKESTASKESSVKHKKTVEEKKMKIAETIQEQNN